MIEKYSMIPHNLEHEGKEVLAIGTGIRGSEFALTRLLSLKNEAGWIVKGDEIEEWKLSGFIQHDGEIYLYGPSFKGESLFEILESGETQQIEKIISMLRAIITLRQNNKNITNISSDAVIFSDDGSILFLPHNLMKSINSTRPIDFKIETFDYINNPQLEEDEAICFTIGVSLYKLITSKFPYTGKTEEEVHDKIRNLSITPPKFIIPELREDVSKYIMELLQIGKETPKMTIDSCYEQIKNWNKENILEKITEEQREEILQTAKRFEEKSIKRFKRTIFWERNWKTVLIVAAIVLTVGIVSGSILKNVLAPRKTKGFSPYKVVKTFYESMNKLDTITISDCVIGKAGKQEINEVTNLYVISRVSMGYEGKSHLITAPQWDKMGRPKLIPPNTVYGILNLSIKKIQGPPTPIFLATYEKWVPMSTNKEDLKNPKPSNKPNYTGFLITDKLFLKKDRGDWVIFKIQRLKQKPIQPIQGND